MDLIINIFLPECGPQPKLFIKSGLFNILHQRNIYHGLFRLGMSVQNLWDTSTGSGRGTPWAPAETGTTSQWSTVRATSRTGRLRAYRWTATPRTRCTPAPAAVWWPSGGYRWPPLPTLGTSTVRTITSLSPVILLRVRQLHLGMF